MTKKNYFVIKNGPSKYDLLMSFCEDKELKFEKESSSRIISVCTFVLVGWKKIEEHPGSYSLEISIIKDSDVSVPVKANYFGVYNPNTRTGSLTGDSVETFFDYIAKQ